MASAAFEAAKAMQARLDREVARSSEALLHFPKSGPLGLTPDHVKASPEYQAAKSAFDRAFASLRNFNSTFTAEFANELRAERRARRNSRSTSHA
jgi:hypothetical protein